MQWEKSKKMEVSGRWKKRKEIVEKKKLKCFEGYDTERSVSSNWIMYFCTLRIFVNTEKIVWKSVIDGFSSKNILATKWMYLICVKFNRWYLVYRIFRSFFYFWNYYYYRNISAEIIWYLFWLISFIKYFLNKPIIDCISSFFSFNLKMTKMKFKFLQ